MANFWENDPVVSGDDSSKFWENDPVVGSKPKTNRTWGEALTDVGGGLISGVGSLMQLPGQVGQLAGITEPEEKPTGLQGIGKTVEEFGQGLKSPVLKAKEQLRSQKIAGAEGEGGALDVAKQAGIAIYETIKDPALITSFFAEQVPNLVGTMGGGLIARGGVKLLMKEATEAAIGKAGVAGAVGTGTIMQGADVGADTYEQVRKRLVAEGTGKEEANRIALEQGRQAALQAAGISLGTALLPGGTSIERALAGKGLPKAGGIARGFFGDLSSEALEEGGGQFVSNLAQQEIFPDVSLTRGVGEAAGMGALGGGLFGGVAGAVNARRDNQLEEQLRLAKDAEEAVQIAAEQERIAANEATNAEIKRRAYAEQGGITTSKAYEELSAEVEEAKAKLAKAEERKLAAQAKVDAKKAAGSAFATAQPDLLGDVLPEQTQQMQQEEAQAAPEGVAPGQLELPLSDQEGQLGLPGMGISQPAPTVEQPAPVESLIISRDITKALGIPGGARNILNLVEGKDLTDPQQRSEVREALAAFAERTQKPGVAGNIEQFLNSPFFAEQGELKLPMRRTSAKQRAAKMSADLEKSFAEMFAEAAKVKPKVPKLPHQRERKAGKLRDQELQAQQAQQQIPVTETPTAQETQDVATGEPTGGIPPIEPTVDRRAGEQGVGVAGVGTGTTTQQAGAPQRVSETGSGRLADTTGRAQRDVQGTAGAPAAVEKTDAYSEGVQSAKNNESALGIPYAEGTPEHEAFTSGYLDTKYPSSKGKKPAAVALTPKQKDQLNYLAGDIIFKVGGAKGRYKKLSPEEKAYVDAQIEAYKNVPPAVLRVARGFSTPALVEAANRGSMARALNEIANNPKYSPLERMVARRLMENKMYSLPKIEVVPKEQLGEADGQYDPMTDTVRIAEGAVDSHTVLHEAVHGYVHALITRFEGGQITNPALADLQRLYNHLLSNNPELAEQYGMTSLTEFASEAMSNADFQAALAQIPYKRTNLLNEFVKKVMQLLGIGNMDTALGEALIQVERALNVGRGYQETNVTGKVGAPGSANVVRSNKAELESLFKAANGRDVAGKNTNPVGSALNENTKANEAEAARTLTTMVDRFETGFLSFDAGLNNAIRRELNKDKRDWTTIKNIMTKISTAQALHSEALAMQFLEKGALRYDPTSYKFFAEERPDSWKSMMALMSDVAKRNGLTDAELRNYANTAFIAERVEGLAKSKPEFYSHMTKEQVAAGRQLFDKIDGLRDVQKVWNGIRANAMDVAVENGLYSRKEADELLQYMDFVPFYREEQLESGAGPRKYPNGFIDFAKNFRIKGSDQPVADVFGNMALWTTYTVSRAVRNRTALNMYETAKEVMPDQVEDLRQDAEVKRSDNVVTFRENGQRKKVKFADPLFVKAFEGMESVTIPTLKEFAKATNFLRQSIVLNPLFSISQLSQDSFAAMMTSGLKNPLMIPFEVVRQFFNILLGANTTGKYLSRTGVVGVNDYSSAVQNNNLAVATGLKPKSVLQKLLTPLEAFSMASDNAVRQALYNRTLLETGGKRQKDGSVKGGDEAAALEKAFEIINFKRSGTSGLVSVFKQLVPFFGAYLQAMNVTAKVLAGRGISPSERAAAYRTLMANTMMVATLGMLYAALNGGDDDYEKMDPQVRDKHLVIPGTGFMLPLRSDFTLFPKLIAEYAYMGITDNGFTDGKKVRRAMTEALGNAILSPTVVPQAIKPFVEVGINHNFFTGRDLVGKGIAGLDKELQYTASTSELGKLLGKLGILAPIEIDHIIKGFAGSVGGLLLLGTNAVMTQGEAPKPEKSTQDALRQIPGMGTFFASEYGNAMKNDFYELRDDVSRAVQSLNRLKKESPEKAREYMEENRSRLQLQTQVNAINNQLAKLREYENQIRALPESRMDAAQKKERIDRIRANEERMLKNVYALRERAGY